MAAAMTVDVACKLPNGLEIEHMGETVVLQGSNSPTAKFGFGITTGIDADWFKAWRNNGGNTLPAVANGSIYELPAKDTKAASARERKNDKRVRTGLEPLNPNEPGKGVEPTDEMKRELAKGPDPDDK